MTKMTLSPARPPACAAQASSRSRYDRDDHDEIPDPQHTCSAPVAQVPPKLAVLNERIAELARTFLDLPVEEKREFAIEVFRTHELAGPRQEEPSGDVRWRHPRKAVPCPDGTTLAVCPNTTNSDRVHEPRAAQAAPAPPLVVSRTGRPDLRRDEGGNAHPESPATPTRRALLGHV